MNKYLLLITISLLFRSAMVYAFSGQGKGTEKDPYLITNASELFEVRSGLAAYYKLVNDIDLTSFIAEDSPQYGWLPIGNRNTPFTGIFDGDNHVIRGLFINRKNEDNIGLFGYIDAATIKNTAIIGAHITGNNYVGGLVGSCNRYNMTDNTTINNIIITGGTVIGNENVGGVLGGCDLETLPSNNSNESPVIEISHCSVEADIIGKEDVGGIIGHCSSVSRDDAWYKIWVYYVMEVLDNTFNAKVQAENNAGGIIGTMTSFSGCSPAFSVSRNIAKGTIWSSSSAGGICGNSQVGIRNNVCVADTISGNSVCRIAPDATGNNYAYNGMVILVNGKEQTNCEDNSANGSGMGLRSLQMQSTYEGLGFDFVNEWKIKDTEGFPYYKTQSEPVSVDEFNSGSKSLISGTTVCNGTIGVCVNGILFESSIVDNTWCVSLGNILTGTIAKVFCVTSGLMPSPCVISKSVQSSKPDNDSRIGDANVDGAVDAADVVSIVNYILGKPSSSFNEKNADINEDGQILVDDAVGTVNTIMYNQ